MDAIAIRFEAIAIGLEAIAVRLEAIGIRKKIVFALFLFQVSLDTFHFLQPGQRPCTSRKKHRKGHHVLNEHDTCLQEGKRLCSSQASLPLALRAFSAYLGSQLLERCYLIEFDSAGRIAKQNDSLAQPAKINFKRTLLLLLLHQSVLWFLPMGRLNHSPYSPYCACDRHGWCAQQFGCRSRIGRWKRWISNAQHCAIMYPFQARAIGSVNILKVASKMGKVPEHH